MKRAWPHLRAAIVAVHCVAIALSALPNPAEGLNRKNWADPTVQAEFDRYAGWLGMESMALQDQAYAIAKVAAKSRAAIVEPFDPYLRVLGIRQNWRMFVAPHRWPTRIEIAGSVDGQTWEPVYFEADPTLRWNADAFDTEPYTGMLFRWGWTSYAKDYDRGCKGLARLLAADRPDFTKVRCRAWKSTTISAAQARAGETPEGKWIFEKVVRL